MEAAKKYIKGKHVLVGGSAGSFKTILAILGRIKNPDFLSLFLVLHRPREGQDKLHQVFGNKCPMDLIEPHEGLEWEKGKVYLAPSSTHLTIDQNGRFSYDNSTHSFSKPSIDVLFDSAASAWKKKVTGILLSGANEDGALGMASIKKLGGKTIIQDPSDCMVDTMPTAAINKAKIDSILNSEEIIQLFNPD